MMSTRQLPTGQFEWNLVSVVWMVATVVFVALFMARWFRAIDEDDRMHAGGARPSRRPADVRIARPAGLTLLGAGLGMLWTVDGLLQARPALAGSGFVTAVLRPLLPGEPGWLDRWLRWAMGVWNAAPLLWDSLAVLGQLAVGMLLLLGGRTKWGRVGLWLSLLWGLVVWVFGEALGGLVSRPPLLPIAGYPGAALLYAVASALLLIPDSAWRRPGFASGVRSALAVLWLLGAVLQAAPPFWTGTGLAGPIAQSAAMRQPAWVAMPIHWLARTALAAPADVNAVAVAALLLIGLGLWMGWRHWLFYSATAGVLAIIWWLGEDFGVFGAGTDPNAAPVWMLLIGCVWLVETRTAPDTTPR